MSYSEQIKKDAKAAAEYLSKHGWCQYDEFNESGACCMNGAIIKATGVENAPSSPLYEVCCQEVGVSVGSLGAIFNDAPGRTKEEVLAIFDRIANS